MKIEEIFEDKRVVKRLKDSGLLTVESVVLMGRSGLPFSKKQADTIIQTAVNAIINKRIDSIEVQEDVIRISCYKIDESVIAALKYELYMDYGVYEIKEDEIIVTRKEENGNWWDSIKDAARRWSYILKEAKTLQIKEDIQISNDPDEVKRYARERGFNGFWRELFADIKGNETFKRALACSLFSTYNSPVNTLIIGEPGSAKTISEEIINSNISDIETVGANLTRAGLVVNYTTGELGVLGNADKMKVIIDELDKAPANDLQYTYELIARGHCDVHTGRIHETIRSRFVLIAMANPKNGIFSSHPINDIPLSPVLVSRFALVIKVGKLEKKERVDLFYDKIINGEQVKKLSEYYNDWIKLSSKHQPRVVASRSKVHEAASELSEIVERYNTTPLRRDERLGNHVRNMMLAIARAEFGDVDDEVIDETMCLLRDSLKEWG